MKCAIVFLALVAVSQAAFTSHKLTQQARPILNDAVLKMRTAGRSANFRESQLTDSIISNLEQQAQSLLDQIENALNHGQNVAANVVSQFQQTVAHLQALGTETHGAASAALQNFLTGIGGIFGNIFGGQKGRSEDPITDQLTALIESFNVEHHVSGVLNNNIIQYVAGLIHNLGLNNLVHSAIAAVLGQDVANYISDHFTSVQGRGLFDGVQNIAGQVSAATQQLIASLTNTFQQVTAAAQQNFQHLQALATQFAQEATAQAHATVTAAASDFLNFLKPYQQDLGELYNNVVAQVGQIVNSI
jgi:ElaB/YqjD/DUF883 family membrane-anchored ribosome-binding protein